MSSIRVEVSGETVELEIPDDTRPVGPGFIRYEDLYRAGDTVSAALARLTEAKVVTFPEGRFEAADFNSGYQAAIDVPKLCRGIVGSGKGSLGAAAGTVFSIKERSSTKGNGAKDSKGNLYIPVQDDKTPCQLNVLKQLDQLAPAVWKNFRVEGTEQGHIFSGFQVHGTAGANVYEDVLVTGWDGNSGAPPGETSGLCVNGLGAHVLTRVEVDGRRTPGGQIFGAMGATVQNNAGAKVVDSYFHHTRAANFVAYQSVNGRLENVVMDSAADIGPYGLGNGGFNLERATGWTMVGGRILGRKNKVHVTYSTDFYALPGTGWTTQNTMGLTLIGVDLAGNLWGNGLGYVQSWTPYGKGNLLLPTPTIPNGYPANAPSSTAGVPACAPVVLEADGVTRRPYRYVLDQHYLVK